MALQSLLDGTSLRSLQILGGADALLSDPTDTALHGSDKILPQSLLGSLPLSGLADDPSALPLPDGQSGGAPVLHTVESLLAGAASTAGVSSGLLGTVNSLTTAIEGIGVQTLAPIANAPITDIHDGLENAAHAGAVAGTVHGIVDLGETIGLGKLGGTNLLTDALDAPNALLHGDLTPVGHLPSDVSSIVGATQGVLTGVESDLAEGAFLADPVGHLSDAISQLTTLSLDGLLNAPIDSLHTTLENAGHQLQIPGITHAITGLGTSIGLGDIGGDNLLTDVTHLPGSVLGGDLSPATHLPGDVGSVIGAAGAALGGVGSDLGGDLLHGVTNPVTGGGLLGGALPGQDGADWLLGQADGIVNGIGNATGLGDLTQATTNAVSGSNGLIGDVLHVPGALAGGASHGAEPIPGDVGTTLGSVGSIVGAAGHEVAGLGSGSGGLLAPVEGALHGGGTGGLLSPIESVLQGDTGGLLAPLQGGGNGGLGGLTGALPGHGADGLVGTATGLLGGAGGSGPGSHDLVTIAAGPQTPNSGLAVDVLSQGNGQTHLVDSHVGTANASTPTVANLGLLSGDSLHIPGASSAGGDALHGVLAGAAGSAAPPAGGADAHAGVDLGAAHADLPIAAAHADPFAALGAAAVHH